jgi:hypothetical protein
MSDIDEENVDSTNDTTEEVEKTDEVVEETTANVVTEDEPKYTESEMKSYARMKKAEAEARQLKKELEELKTPKAEPNVAAKPSEKQDDGLTSMDVLVLSKANITETEDIEEIISYAKFRSLPVKDVLKDKTMQTILRDKAEMRATAEATNTGTARRGSTKPSDQQIIDEVQKGKLPENPADYAEARWESKRVKK